MLALGGLLARLVIIWTGWTEGPIIADDAFYYFKIASNIANGAGPTFDGLAPTNGYHPLWLWTLVPLFKAAGDSLWLPVRLALMMAALCGLGTGWLILAIIRALGAGRGDRLAALFWFLSPFTLLLGLRGMEASLSALLVVAVFWRIAVLARSSHEPRLGDAAVTGVLLGLAGLARLDNLIVLGLALAVFAVGLARSTATLPGRVVRRWLTVVAAVALVVVLPWLIWNQMTFGSPVPVSGQVKTHFGIYGTLATDWHSVKGVARTLTNATVAPLFHAARFASLEEFSSARFTLAATLGLVAAVLVPLLRRRRILRDRYRATRGGAVLWAILAFMAGHVVLMSMVWRAYVNWYALPSLALYAVVLGVVVAPGDAVSGSRPWLFRLSLASAVVFCVVLYGRFFAGIELGPALRERQHRLRFETLAAAYPDGVRAGAFNAGMLGYVAPRFGDITVINLDCRVNNVAFAAAHQGRLSQYILDHVEVMLEVPSTGHYLFGPGELDTLEARYVQWPRFKLWSQDGPPP